MWINGGQEKEGKWKKWKKGGFNAKSQNLILTNAKLVYVGILRVSLVRIKLNPKS